MVSFEAREEYIIDMRTQLTDLITIYDAAVLWFDGDRTNNDGDPTLSKWWNTTDAEDLYEYLMDLDSTLNVNDRIIRWNGLGDFESAEPTIPDEPLERLWEACRNMNDAWGYNRNKMDRYKSSTQLIREMIKTVSRDGNFLLNIGPMRDGTVPTQESDILQDFGDWMEVYSESIYGTTRSPCNSEPNWGFVTKKPGKIYLHVLNWPSNKLLKVSSTSDTVKNIYLLNDTTKLLNYSIDDDDITITVPENIPNPHNSVIVMDFTGEPLTSASISRIDESITLFPNPVANGILNIEQSLNSRLDISVYNIHGQQLLRRKKGGKILTINVSALSPDVYYVKISNGKKVIQTKLSYI